MSPKSKDRSLLSHKRKTSCKSSHWRNWNQRLFDLFAWTISEMINRLSCWLTYELSVTLVVFLSAVFEEPFFITICDTIRGHVVVQTTSNHLVEPVSTHRILPVLQLYQSSLKLTPVLLHVLCCCSTGSWTLWGCSQPWPWCRASSWVQCGLERTGLWSTTLRGRIPQRLWLPSWSPATL